MTARTFSVEIVNATDVSAAVATTKAWVLGSRLICRRLRTAASSHHRRTGARAPSLDLALLAGAATKVGAVCATPTAARRERLAAAAA
jgi:hypothetical protein